MPMVFQGLPLVEVPVRRARLRVDNGGLGGSAMDQSVPTGLELTVFDAVFRERPHERFDALRAAEPVHEDKVLNRLVLTRAVDIAALLKDRSLSVDPSKSAPGSFSAVMLPDVAASPDKSILFLDDPDHRRLRGLVSKAFNARSIDSLRPHIAAIADALLDALAGRGEFDLIADYCSPLPIIVIAEILGVDTADRADFRRWSQGSAQAFSPVKSPETIALLEANRQGLEAYFSRVIAERRAAPRDDLISAMIAAETDGDRMTTREIVVMCNLLLIAGNLTTTDLIGNAVLALLRNPDQLAKLRARPALMPAAVEETLRLDPPVTDTVRTPLCPMRIDGVEVPAGGSVDALLMAGGLDPALHADPLRFDIERADKTHFAFGGGLHFCLGAPLAKAEAEIALERLLARFPRLALAGRPVARNITPSFNGVEALWVTP